MTSSVMKLYLGDIHRPWMPAAHDGLSKRHGDAYGIRWRTGKTKCRVSTEVAGYETTSNKTEEIAGWTANSHFQKPACLFQLDRASKTYSCPFISFSGNLRFRSSSQ